MTRVLASMLVASLVIATLMPPAAANDFILQVSFTSPQKEAVALNLVVGQSRMIRFDQPIGRLSVSNPDIAEAVVVATDQVVVNGKSFGHVNFIAWDKDGERPVVFDVSVRVNLTLMDALMRELFPKDAIHLSQANGSIVLSGNVSDARKVTLAENAIQAAGFKTVNLLQGPFKDTPQVQLQVQVAEVNRSRAKELGLAYLYQSRPGVGGFVRSDKGPAEITSVIDGIMTGTLGATLNVLFLGGNFNAFVRALNTNGALRTLAEPNLTALDGVEANFLAGGEFPVPIIQGAGGASTVGIIFKEFGVRLNFKPTVIDEDHIRLELQPEVSTIDFANGVAFSGFRIPALRTRRAKTSVELKNGQSFALAGLLDTNEIKALSKVPWIGDVPILGQLFRSSDFQKQETELMFIITVNLVKSIKKDDLPDLPGLDGLKSKSPLTETTPQKGEPGATSGTGSGSGSGSSSTSGSSSGSGSGSTPAEPEKKAPEKPETPPSQASVSNFDTAAACRSRVMSQGRLCGSPDASMMLCARTPGAVASPLSWRPFGLAFPE